MIRTLLGVAGSEGPSLQDGFCCGAAVRSERPPPETWRRCSTLGGFPEPYFMRIRDRGKTLVPRVLITEELTSLERVQDLGQMELLAIRLPELVGSPLSLNSLREDMQISHKTVARWLTLLERLYAVFRLAPFGAPRIRAVKKEQKHYHFDWSLVPDASFRFENMIACHLLKWVHYEIDTKGRNLELRYFRDVDGRETDFVIVERRKPLKFIEVKWDDAEINTGLKYLKARFPNCEAWQISARGTKDYLSPQGIRVSPALPFLRRLS